MTKRDSALSIILASVMLAISGCSEKAIMISRGDVNERNGVQGATMLGSERNSKLKQTLCNRDLDRILRHTSLDPFQQQEFREKLCGSDTSEQEAAEYFNALPVNQKREFESACKHYGYYINDYG